MPAREALQMRRVVFGRLARDGGFEHLVLLR
jgi:hypothetical protein